MTETSPPMPQFCWSSRLSSDINHLLGTLRTRRCLILTLILFLAGVLTFGHTAYKATGQVKTSSSGLKSITSVVWKTAWSFQADQDTQSSEEKDTLHNDVPRVLLMTYMRGGSSVLGEAFNQNPEAFHWFEPLDGIYSHLYGTGHGWMPLDILFYRNGTIRNIPQYERDAIVGHLRNVFDCNVRRLPLDVLTNHNLITIIQNKVFRYAECIRLGTTKPAPGGFRNYIRKDPRWTSKLARKPSFSCKRTLSSRCPQGFTQWNQMEMCHRDIHGYRDPSLPNQPLLSQSLNASYHLCMKKALAACKPCFHILSEECSSSKLRAVKVIRLNPELLSDLLNAIPNLKVVAYFRDPRAIVVSRKRTRLLSRTSARNPISEGELLCKRLRHDLKTLDVVGSQFSERLYKLRYEDLIGNPTKAVVDLYAFLGLEMSSQTRLDFEARLHASRDTGVFGTSRQNATATANRWLRQITFREKTLLTAVCSDVLEKLGYSL